MYTRTMDRDSEVRKDCLNRLKRARGQIDGIISMVEDGRSCTDVVTQIAAASKALERVGFKIIATELHNRVQVEPQPAEPWSELERLFLSLA